MPKKIREVRPPHDGLRILARLPIWIFRLHLDWLLGNHFLLLTHRGRKSGRARQTVLEVLHYNKENDIYSVFAGFGEASDWVRNVEKTPQVTIEVGGRKLHRYAKRVSPQEAEKRLRNYARRFPLARRVLPRLMGYHVDGSEADFAALAQLGIVIAFVPASPTQEEND